MLKYCELYSIVLAKIPTLAGLDLHRDFVTFFASFLKYKTAESIKFSFQDFYMQGIGGYEFNDEQSQSQTVRSR